MPRELVVAEGTAKPIGPFSAAVRDQDIVYTSGHVAQDPATGHLITGDVARQTEQIFVNLEAVLRAAGKTFADVLKVNVFLTDMHLFPAMNGVYAKFFEPPYPARTTVCVLALPLGAAIEIDMTAR